ncbi:hypothetical protein LTS18_000886, partial [Coniosporium uncinatum]
MGKKRRRQDEDDDGARANGSNGVAAVKKQRQFTVQDSKLAKLYEELASEVSSARIKAAKDLLLELSDVDQAVVKKSISRLIKGLCSSRKAARLGFFVALTELLRQSFDAEFQQNTAVGVDELVELVTRTTSVEGKASGQEKRDYLLGRVTG